MCVARLSLCKPEVGVLISFMTFLLTKKNLWPAGPHQRKVVNAMSHADTFA